GHGVGTRLRADPRPRRPARDLPDRPRPPAAGTPQQLFELWSGLYDVTAAIGLLRAAPRPPQPFPVMAWARAYGLIPVPGGGPHMVSLIGPGPGFDPEYAMGTATWTSR
ncbi:MAG: hypothetical protein ACLPKE_20745, partial [Streptosporangiaceae bacterium]